MKPEWTSEFKVKVTWKVKGKGGAWTTESRFLCSVFSPQKKSKEIQLSYRLFPTSFTSTNPIYLGFSRGGPEQFPQFHYPRSGSGGRYGPFAFRPWFRHRMALCFAPAIMFIFLRSHHTSARHNHQAHAALARLPGSTPG